MRAVAIKKGQSREQAAGLQETGTLRCEGCGEEFVIGHDLASVDKWLADKQAHWLERVLADEHEREKKHPDRLRERIRLDSVICVVDADEVFAHPEYPPLMELKLRQVGFADMLILNKLDLAGPEQVGRVRAWLDEHFSRLRIVETNFCDVPYEILLGVGRFDPTRAAINSHADKRSCTDANCHDDHHEPDHSKMFSTWSYETDRPLALEALRETLRKLPGSVYRAKGVVYTTDAPQRRAVLQVVGRRVDISLHEWGGRAPRTQIVAIGAAGSIDAMLLEKTFASCISTAGI